ncbi:SMEK domain-containing protein [Chitinophaga sp. 22536]|uniref:SMEK domain-containing protein n=1 Tax=unclassified Chitinophaga TaxID=2619133 RepID=UPI003F872688
MDTPTFTLIFKRVILDEIYPYQTMNIERQSHIDEIINKLTFLKVKVQLSNPLNLTDINIISENFYRDLLNIIFSLNLENTNIATANADTIDLRDESTRICFQVTSTSALTKTKKTVNGFIKNKLYEKFDRLIILNIVAKSDHQSSKIGDPNFYELDTKEDIWDVDYLIRHILNEPIEKIKEVCGFLKKEIKSESDQTLAKEVTTFISLVGYLSDDNQPSAGNGYIEQPDPEGKIMKRFSAHSDYLIKEYQDLYTEFGLVLTDVLQQSDIGHTRMRRLGLHLKHTSDLLLTEMNDDPKIALEALIGKHEAVLSRQGVEYSSSAVRFFLIDQLIKCNVFPNKEIYNV